MEISPFPAWSPLHLSHQGVFDAAFSRVPPEISEYTFTNLYAWRQSYGFEVSRMGEALLVCARRKAGGRLFPPAGTPDEAGVIKAVMAEMPLAWERMPERFVSALRDIPGWEVVRDEANFDYVYRVRDLAELPGRKYDGKRNHIKKFREQYAFEYLVLDESHAAQCLAFQDDWCAIKDCDNDLGLSSERDAVREMLAHCHLWHLIAGAITLQGRICALAIGEKLNLSTMVMHVLKADPRIPGLYQAMLNEFLSRSAGSFEFVNLEQDLGLEGLRRAKQSYHPAFQVEKFILRPLGTDAAP